MDSKRVEILLDKYWACLTTLEEEAALRAFFRENGHQPAWQKTGALFQYFDQERQQAPLKDEFDRDIVEQLPPKTGRQVNFWPMAKWGRAAAIGLLVVVSSYLAREQYLATKVQPVVADTFEDPQKAFEEAKRALQLVANNLKKGQKQAVKLAAFGEAQEKVKNNKTL